MNTEFLKTVLLTLLTVFASASFVFADVISPGEAAKKYWPYYLMFAGALVLIMIVQYIDHKRNQK